MSKNRGEDANQFPFSDTLPDFGTIVRIHYPNFQLATYDPSFDFEYH